MEPMTPDDPLPDMPRQEQDHPSRGSSPRSGGSRRRRRSASSLRLTVAVLNIDFFTVGNTAVCVVEFGTDDNTVGAATGMVAAGLITAAWLLTDRIAADSPPGMSTGGPGDLWSGGFAIGAGAEKCRCGEGPAAVACDGRWIFDDRCVG